MKKAAPFSGFLNVDLQIRSRAKLEALETAFGNAVYALYSGPADRGTWMINLESPVAPAG